MPSLFTGLFLAYCVQTQASHIRHSVQRTHAIRLGFLCQVSGVCSKCANSGYQREIAHSPGLMGDHSLDSEQPPFSSPVYANISSPTNYRVLQITHVRMITCPHTQPHSLDENKIASTRTGTQSSMLVTGTTLDALRPLRIRATH